MYFYAVILQSRLPSGVVRVAIVHVDWAVVLTYQSVETRGGSRAIQTRPSHPFISAFLQFEIASILVWKVSILSAIKCQHFSLIVTCQVDAHLRA